MQLVLIKQTKHWKTVKNIHSLTRSNKHTDTCTLRSSQMFQPSKRQAQTLETSCVFQAFGKVRLMHSRQKHSHSMCVFQKGEIFQSLTPLSWELLLEVLLPPRSQCCNAEMLLWRWQCAVRREQAHTVLIYCHEDDLYMTPPLMITSYAKKMSPGGVSEHMQRLQRSHTHSIWHHSSLDPDWSNIPLQTLMRERNTGLE